MLGGAHGEGLRGEGHRVDGVLAREACIGPRLATQLRPRLGVRQVPHLDHLGLSAGDQDATVRVEGDREHDAVHRRQPQQLLQQRHLRSSVSCVVAMAARIAACIACIACIAARVAARAAGRLARPNVAHSVEAHVARLAAHREPRALGGRRHA